MTRKAKKKAKKELVPYANEVEEAAHFLSLNNDGKANKKKERTKRTKRKNNKRTKRTRRTRRGKLAGNPDCDALIDENDCKSNSRCKWNNFEIRDFDMNTSKGREKLFTLKESIMKKYNKKELRKFFGSEDPSFFQVYMRAKKEYDNGLRGLCGNKMYHGSKLGDLLQERVKKDFPDLPNSKSKTKIKRPQIDTDLVEDLLKKAMKKSKPDKEIQAIIDKFDLQGKDLQRIYDKNNKQFSKLDKYLAPDQDEVSGLLDMVDDELKLEKREEHDIQERINRLKKSAKAKKTKKPIKKKPKK